MPHVLGLNIPNFLPDWRFLQPAGRLIWASLIFGVLTGIAFVLIKTPKRSAEPATWAATIAGAIVVWGWMTLAYAVIPHEWLNFSASYLNFGKDTYALRRNSIIPTDVNREAIGHIVVTGIYVQMLVLNVYLFSAWQKRKVAEPATAAEDEGPTSPVTGPFARLRRARAGTSAYGRPVTTAE